MTALLFSVATFLMTLLGGVFALRFKDRLCLILGFSGGAVLAVAFLDVIPEALKLGAPRFGPGSVLGLTIVGFAAYLVLDRLPALHLSRKGLSAERWLGRGTLGATSLCVHSLMDGFAIGVAFKVSPSVGFIVSIAVLVHDFSDGMNTVGIILGHEGSDQAATGWLVADAVAPVLGVSATTFVPFRPDTLSILLALCGGFFIYLSTSDLLPESRHGHPIVLTTLATILGIAVVYTVTQVAQY